MRRPEPSEYHEFYAGYVDLVPEGDLLRTLEEGIRDTLALLERIPTGRGTYRYGPDRWSVRDVVGHVTDSERLFSFRALHIARNDPAPLPGIDQEAWAAASNAHDRSLAEHAAELRRVRGVTLDLFRGLPAGAHDRRGIASGHPVTVRGLAGIIAGHEAHHRRILEERYVKPILGAAGSAGDEAP